MSKVWKLNGLALYDPLKAVKAIFSITILVGVWLRKILSWVCDNTPSGTENFIRVTHFTGTMHFLSIALFRAQTIPLDSFWLF
jgi:hypothetical protein